MVQRLWTTEWFFTSYAHDRKWCPSPFNPSTRQSQPGLHIELCVCFASDTEAKTNHQLPRSGFIELLLAMWVLRTEPGSPSGRAKLNTCSISPSQEPTFLFLKIMYLFYLYEYTVTIFRHTRKRHPVPLQMVLSYNVVAGN